MAYLYDNRNDYSTAVDDVESQLKEWREDMKDMTEDERAKTKQRLDDLDSKIDDFRNKLETDSSNNGVTDAINEAWNDLKREAEDLMD